MESLYALKSYLAKLRPGLSFLPLSYKGRLALFQFAQSPNNEQWMWCKNMEKKYQLTTCPAPELFHFWHRKLENRRWLYSGDSQDRQEALESQRKRDMIFILENADIRCISTKSCSCIHLNRNSVGLCVNQSHIKVCRTTVPFKKTRV